LYQNLQAFIGALKQAGEVKVISQPISPILEISQYTDAESKSPRGGKALYFESVTGSPHPVATNIFGSSRRICMALGVDHLDQLADRMRTYIDFSPPRSLKEALGILPMALNLTKFFPRNYRGKTAPCQEVVLTGDEVDLSTLPVIQCWPKDAGRFVTLPLVITRSLETGKRNLGMYRLQIFDRNTTGMHWHIHKDGSHFYNEYRKAGRRMPVAVAIGADPATTYAGTAPMPRGMDELLLAGFIRNRPVRLTRCVTNDLQVPAESEFVLEGYVDPGELRREGPFGDHTGYYSLADDYPVFHVTAVTHRKNPVYHTTLVGRPPMEDCYLAQATERLFLPMLQTVMPEIRDYWFPWEGVFHNIAIVAIEKEYAGHAQKIMSGLWGQGQMSFCKAIVVVDDNISPQDPTAVIRTLLTRLDPASDITLTKGVLDVLDHSSPHVNFGNKIGLDLTTRFVNEPPRNEQRRDTNTALADTAVQRVRETNPAITGGRELFTDADVEPGAGLRILAFTVDKRRGITGKDLANELLALPDLASFDILVFFDRRIDLADGSLMLWKVFNNVDPGRDLIARGARLALDATRKGPADGHDREWPDELTFDV
jgi:4-hydroxy-3-polyprenylbenzoate decarboxylase